MRVGLQVVLSEILRRGVLAWWRQWIREVGIGGRGCREGRVRVFVVGLLGLGWVRLGVMVVALVDGGRRRRSGGVVGGFSGVGRMREIKVEMVRRIGKGRRGGVGMTALSFSQKLRRQ